MRLFRPASLALLLGLSACGGGAQPAKLMVACGGSTELAGASSIDVVVDPVTHAATLSFPDPVNEGKTGTIAVRNRCTITPKG